MCRHPIKMQQIILNLHRYHRLTLKDIRQNNRNDLNNFIYFKLICKNKVQVFEGNTFAFHFFYMLHQSKDAINNAIFILHRNTNTIRQIKETLRVSQERVEKVLNFSTNPAELRESIYYIV